MHQRKYCYTTPDAAPMGRQPPLQATAPNECELGLTSAGKEVVYKQRIQSVAPMMVISQPMLCRW